MTFAVFVLLISMVSFSRARGIHPSILVPVSNATCQPGYAWMNNAEQFSPCLTVAYVIGACAGQTWTQPALPSGYSYNSPNGTTATPCYCSWSCYNLMMACTLCQSPAYTGYVTTWPSFSETCPSNYKNQIFPQGYVLADDASIPYWATIDPTTWPSLLFDIQQAKDYANQNHSDYLPFTSSSSGSSINPGAIIGGAVGGFAGLLLLFLGCYLVYKCGQRRRLFHANGPTPTPHADAAVAHAHARRPSDPSTVYFASSMGFSVPVSYATTQVRAEGNAHLSLQAASPSTPSTAVQRAPAIPMV